MYFWEDCARSKEFSRHMISILAHFVFFRLVLVATIDVNWCIEGFKGLLILDISTFDRRPTEQVPLSNCCSTGRCSSSTTDAERNARRSEADSNCWRGRGAVIRKLTPKICPFPEEKALLNYCLLWAVGHVSLVIQSASKKWHPQ